MRAWPRSFEAIKRDVEAEQRRLTEAHALQRLAELGRLTSKLDKVINQVTYASRGYRGFFDTYKLTQAKLDKLYEFDLGLFAAVDSARAEIETLLAAAAKTLLRNGDRRRRSARSTASRRPSPPGPRS